MGEPKGEKPNSKQLGRSFRNRWVVASAAVLLGALWIPDAAPPTLKLPEGKAFQWDQDDVFSQLEETFASSQGKPCPKNLEEELDAQRFQFRQMGAALADPSDPAWDKVEQRFFRTMASAGGCHKQLPVLLVHRDYMRKKVRSLADRWEKTAAARDRLYRLLYGTRLATEELLLQMPPEVAPTLSLTHEEPSKTPSAEVEGVEIHSGDLLVSRGGAATSAFIARGSDYPGNFSHVALVHVDEETKDVSIIESHIESGVGISKVEDYLDDKKLRVLVLRPRSDLPELLEDPTLPHAAATDVLKQARRKHIPYDFAMNIEDASAQFCSEVASSAYWDRGIALWSDPTRFSSPGLARWMSSLGVRHLETHGPSDLEYDPHLRVVAEWHDPKELFKDHIDNAVIDVMLEYAEAGAEFDYNFAMLPLARLGKAYSWLLNRFGAVGPVPEGMSATVALRAQWLTATHEAIVAGVEERAAAFEAGSGYRAPYWRLVELARAETLTHLGKLPGPD